MSSNHIFDHLAPQRREPLAARMRPETIDDIVGQSHILGAGRLLRRAILSDQISSLIFYGPPGTGKTTLARVIAYHTKGNFMSINAVLSGIAKIRESIEEAQQTFRVTQQKSILFIDEVHRFNKSQQDALLPHVENGTIILIGATTENPYFEVNKALVSRSRVFELRSLSVEDLENIVDKALSSKRGYGQDQVSISTEAKAHLVQTCNGDARTLLNAIELAVEPELMKAQKDERGESIHIDLAIAEESIQKRALLYDRDGDAHYDIISAFIKSMRGSDADAALYWLAKMVHAGEDPRFIFRRMIIAASEDVGLASPEVLGQVMAAAQAYDYVGMPEGQFHLTQACLAICNAAKSNSTLGYFEALRAVKKAHAEKDDVPNHLKDSSRDGDDLGHGKGYKYPHAFENHWVAQHYLPEGMQGQIFYHPSDQGSEKSVLLQTEKRREACWAAFNESSLHDSTYEQLHSTAERWKQRSIDNGEKQLQMIRDLSFESAQIQREDLVLDAHTHSGFFTLEATRSCPSGGVHSLCWTQKEKDQLRQLCSGLPELDRPFLHGPVSPEEQTNKLSLQTIQQWWREHGEQDIRFDVIFLRHQCEQEADVPQSLEAFKHNLTDRGRIISCDYLWQQDQRLWQSIQELHDASNTKSTALQQLEDFKQLEESFFKSSHFKNNKQSNDYALPEHHPLKVEAAETVQVSFKKQFFNQHVQHWCSPSSALGRFLLETCGEEKTRHWETWLSGHLNNKIVHWKRQLLISRYGLVD